MSDFWWDYNLFKRKMNCPVCYGTGKSIVTIGAKCSNCGGAGEIILEEDDQLSYDSLP